MGQDRIYKGRAPGAAAGIVVMVLLLMAGGAGAAPAEEWNRTFGGTGWDNASSVQQISSGGCGRMGKKLTT